MKKRATNAEYSSAKSDMKELYLFVRSRKPLQCLKEVRYYAQNLLRLSERRPQHASGYVSCVRFLRSSCCGSGDAKAVSNWLQGEVAQYLNAEGKIISELS